MQINLIIALLLIAQTMGSLVNTQQHALHKRGNTKCKSIDNACPDLNFSWDFDNQDIMPYYLSIESVIWLDQNLYEITVHVMGAEQIDIKYLYALKIIGVNGPKSTILLYGDGDISHVITSPTNFSVSFEVYADTPKDNCDVWLPDFKIQYEYLEGSAAKFSDTWVWGDSTFDLRTGCTIYDNNGNSQTDFPGFYWRFNCNEDCIPNVEYSSFSSLYASSTALSSTRTYISTSTHPTSSTNGIVPNTPSVSVSSSHKLLSSSISLGQSLPSQPTYSTSLSHHNNQITSIVASTSSVAKTSEETSLSSSTGVTSQETSTPGKHTEPTYSRISLSITTFSLSTYTSTALSFRSTITSESEPATTTVPISSSSLETSGVLLTSSSPIYPVPSTSLKISSDISSSEHTHTSSSRSSSTENTSNESHLHLTSSVEITHSHDTIFSKGFSTTSSSFDSITPSIPESLTHGTNSYPSSSISSYEGNGTTLLKSKKSLLSVMIFLSGIFLY